MLFVTNPGKPGRSATTTLWLAFDSPQDLLEYKGASANGGAAMVTAKRYRW